MLKLQEKFYATPNFYSTNGLETLLKDKEIIEALNKDIDFLLEQRKYELAKIDRLELALARMEKEKNFAVQTLKNCVDKNGLCDGCVNFNGQRCKDEEKAIMCDTKGFNYWEWGYTDAD